MSISVNSLREEETYGAVIFFLFLGHNRVIRPRGPPFNKPCLIFVCTVFITIRYVRVVSSSNSSNTTYDTSTRTIYGKCN